MTTSANAGCDAAARRQPSRRRLGRRAFLALLPLFSHAVSWASAAEFKPLDPVAEIKVERIERFVAADAFRIGNRIGGRTLSAVGLSFTEHFLGIIEKDVPAASLGRWTLPYTTGDSSLIRALGGEEKAAVPFLAYIHRVMDMEGGGAGHTDWRSNFAYVRSPVDQRLWAVHWTVNDQNEWTIGAVYVPHPHLDWRSGSYLFSGLTFPSGLSSAAGMDTRIGCPDAQSTARGEPR